MKKFQKIAQVANDLKQSGYEHLDGNLTLLTCKSQDTINQWCQEELDNILEQIIDKGAYNPPIEYGFYSSQFKDWVLELASKVQEAWEDWHEECCCIPTYSDHCKIEEPFEYLLSEEEYFQLDGLYVHLSSDYGGIINYIGEDLSDLYDFLIEDESCEELILEYFGKKKLSQPERLYLSNFSF